MRNYAKMLTVLPKEAYFFLYSPRRSFRSTVILECYRSTHLIRPCNRCGHQLTPFMMGGFVVDVATITPGWSQPLQNALRSAAQCLCEHRFRKLDAEFAESAVLTENRTETAEDDSRSDSSGEGSSGTTAEASPDISFRAPTMDWFAPVEEESKDEESSTSQRGEIVSSKFAKTPASEPSVPLSPVQPLSCGNVNPLRSAAAARLNDETFKHSSAPNANSIERSHDDQPSKSKAWVDGLVPSELTCNWPTMPTFQLGHTDFSGVSVGTSSFQTPWKVSFLFDSSFLALD